MTDQPTGKGFDPQQPAPGGSTQGQPQQQGSQHEDDELSDFLQKEHGHTKQTADAEVKRDREGVKKKKKDHEERHGSSSSRR